MMPLGAFLNLHLKTVLPMFFPCELVFDWK